jgi:glycosyltransferase involved in cell wall biosynthesis
MEHRLTEALQARGVTFGESKLLVHFIPFYYFQIRRFRHNVLYSMYEFDRVPRQWHGQLQKPELIIVPSEHNRVVLQDVTQKPVVVCPAGVDSERYGFKARSFSEPFVFLYVGAKNPRKGVYHVAKAWELWNERYPDLAKRSILIMKETEEGVAQELKQVTCNAYVDTRVLPLEATDDLPSLVSLYHYAHCFLFPTMGEGFGLTLAEAMSTGLPCIYTPWSGTEDIGEDLLAYPIKYGWKKIELMDPSGAPVDPVLAADPDIDSIVEQMHHVFTRYDEALERGKIAAIKMREHFTWERAADRFISIISACYPEEAA